MCSVSFLANAWDIAQIPQIIRVPKYLNVIRQTCY